MHCANHVIDREQDDQPLDLPPVAEMDMVSQIPAVIGARRRFKSGIVAETGNQILGIFKTLPARQIWHQHTQLPKAFEQYSKTPFQRACQFWGSMACCGAQ